MNTPKKPQHDLENDWKRAGERASAIVLFGPDSRYGCFAIHSRSGYLVWCVVDGDELDPWTNCPAVVMQSLSFEGAVSWVLRA